MLFQRFFVKGKSTRWILLFCLLCVGFFPSSRIFAQATLLEWNLWGDIPDEKSPFFLPLPGFEKPQPCTLEVLKILENARKDKNVAGLIIKLKGQSMGLAKIQEVREALLRFKDGGKKIYSYSEGFGNSDYFFASASDRISLHPSGSVFLVGLAMEAIFLRGTLDLLGIFPDYSQVGQYKSAADTFVRKNMSEAHREVTHSILDDLYDQFTKGIAEGRGMSQELVKELIDSGPFTALGAKKSGLVDFIQYEDEFEENIEKEYGRGIKKVQFADYGKKPRPKGFFEMLFGPEEPAGGKKIAVIYASGPIVSGKSTGDLLLGKIMGSETMAKLIRDTRKDESIKAIIFRIDSPGGSGLASDVIYRETLLAKKAKPFIVSMSNVAGSGGYYIAMGADKIVAEPGTITGSIGVLGGKFDLSGLYEKIGLGVEVITRGKNADFFDSSRRFTAEQKEKLERFIWEFYEDFVKKVAKGRGKSIEEIDAIARGRIWTGRQAVANGLVDDLGGLGKAISTAREMAGIPEGEFVQIVTLPREKTLLDMIKELVEIQIAARVLPAELRCILGEIAKKKILEKERVILQMPCSYRIE